MRAFPAIAVLVCLSLPAGALAELRAYEVDAKYRQEVFQALRGILQDRPNPTGRVERLPTGQVLIDAAPEVHAQIETILDSIAARETAAAPRITLRYWAVLGSPGEADAADVPAIRRDVLDEIEAVHGDLGFRVLGNATLVTESGQSGELEGNPLTVMQETYAQGTALNALIQIEFNYPLYVRPMSGDGAAPFRTREILEQRVDLRTTLEAGEFVVLGENTLGENTIEGDGLSGTMFYIVHWPAER